VAFTTQPCLGRRLNAGRTIPVLPLRASWYVTRQPVDLRGSSGLGVAAPDDGEPKGKRLKRLRGRMTTYGCCVSQWAWLAELKVSVARATVSVSTY
jgi:hypothetical protein